MGLIDIEPLPCLWERLKCAEKPIILYGMGDGAQKVLDVMSDKGIAPSGVMASDDFVRGHSFHGFRVKKYSEIKEEYGEVIILVCFGTSRREVMDNILKIAAEQELYVPDVPVIGGGLFDKEYAREHYAELSAVYDMLADEQSRQIYSSWLNYRITGDISGLLPLQDDGVYSLLSVGESEVFADLGAFNGDTVAKFLAKANNKAERVYAFEPDEKSLKRLVSRHSALGDKLIAVNAGAWDKDEQLPFIAKGGRNSGFLPYTGGLPPKASDIKLTDMRSLDSVLGEEKVTVIKLDTEGCEDRALDGCGRHILRDRPRLIVSLYHRVEDMFMLPLKIKALCPEYKMYLREPPYIPAWDMELYCECT